MRLCGTCSHFRVKSHSSNGLGDGSGAAEAAKSESAKLTSEAADSRLFDFVLGGGDLDLKDCKCTRSALVLWAGERAGERLALVMIEVGSCSSCSSCAVLGRSACAHPEFLQHERGSASKQERSGGIREAAVA